MRVSREIIKKKTMREEKLKYREIKYVPRDVAVNLKLSFLKNSSQ